MLADATTFCTAADDVVEEEEEDEEDTVLCSNEGNVGQTAVSCSTEGGAMGNVAAAESIKEKEGGSARGGSWSTTDDVTPVEKDASAVGSAVVDKPDDDMEEDPAEDTDTDAPVLLLLSEGLSRAAGLNPEAERYDRNCLREM